jgi:EAL domain-containing protein (putative c-di-GMP-specific phosphodiesterase class I)
VAATVGMAHALGIDAAADGVTTETQLERLSALGCDVVQGDLLGPPMSPGRALELVDPHGRWQVGGHWHEPAPRA